jgi:predicted HicB family RNase H-like nuclease
MARHEIVGHIAQVIDDDLHRRARVLAVGKGQSFKAWVETAIREKVERDEADEQKRRRQAGR